MTKKPHLLKAELAHINHYKLNRNVNSQVSYPQRQKLSAFAFELLAY